MKIKIEIDTSNEAFGNDRIFEVQRILTKYIPQLKEKSYIPLYDLNGNKVGFIEDIEENAEINKSMAEYFKKQEKEMFG